MMGPRQEAQAALFYEFSLEDHVPQDHLLRSIDRFVDLGFSALATRCFSTESAERRPSLRPRVDYAKTYKADTQYRSCCIRQSLEVHIQGLMRHQIGYLHNGPA